MENNMFEGIFSPMLAAATPTNAPQQPAQSLNAPAPAKTAGPDNTPKYPGEPWMEPSFHQALIQLESRGDPKARGDDKAGPPQAWGLYQQHPEYVKQANKVLDTWRRGNPLNPSDKPAFDALAKKYKDFPRFTPADRDDPIKAEQMFRVMTEWNSRRFQQKHGRPPTELELASIHHLGTIDGVESDTEYQKNFAAKKEELKKKKK